MGDKNFFSAINSKTSFILGLIVGLLILCTVGFFVMLGGYVKGGFAKGSSNNAALNNQQANNNLNQAAAVAPTNNNAPVNITISKDDHIRGDINAPVKIVEYSDYQCPYCQVFHPTMQQVMTDYKGKVAWIFRHFPLDSLHPNARPAAEASECVFDQKGDNGFWQFTDGVYDNQDRIGSALFEELAQKAGVNMAKFKDCVSSGKFKQKVEADYQQGITDGVNGTPGSFVNGIPVRGALPYASIKQMIDSELSKS